MTPTERSARRAAISAAKERAAKATPDWRGAIMEIDGRAPTPEEIGTYITNSIKRRDCPDFHFVWTEKPDGEADIAHFGNGPTSAANMEFAIAARTDVPLLADDADRYHDLVERVEALARSWESDSRTANDDPMWRAACELRTLLTPGEPSFTREQHQSRRCWRRTLTSTRKTCARDCWR